MSRHLAISAALLLALVARSDAATVRTLDGRFCEGEVRIEKGALQVRPAPAAAPVEVQLSNLLSADFRVPAAAPPVTPRWTARDIGTVVAPGLVQFNNGTVTVRAAGSGIGGTADAGQFLMQRVEGDAQVVARVMSLRQSHPMAKAVLMFRASMDPAAPAVAVAFQAAGNSAFQYRPKPGANTALREGGAVELPVYLKLARRDNTFSGYISADGENWSSLGSQEVKLPTTAFAGLAVSSNAAHSVTTATFDNLSLTRTLSLTAAGGDDNSARGVVLRNGSVLTGRVRRVNAMAVSLTRPREPNMTVPLAQVAIVFLAPLTADVVARLPEDRQGVLLANGDFVQGNVLDVSESRVKLSSILFGIKRFPTRQVAVISYGGMPTATPTAYHLRATDGSSLLFDDVELAANMVHIKDPILSDLLFPLPEVSELNAGLARVVPLTALKPDAVEPEGEGSRYAVGASLSGGPLVLSDRVVEDAIAIRDNTRLAYDIDGRYELLSLQFAVPRETPPAHSATLIVTADGRELYRTEPRTAAQAPVAAKIDLTGVSRLELAVEGEGQGVVIAPVLVRANRAD